MTAIAFPIPEQIRELADGVERFIRAEVMPRHDQHARILEEPRLLFAPDGRFSHEVEELMREVRMAASKAGYFTMSVPRELGGAGFGMLAYFVAWERIAHICGGRYWLLGHQTISHWAFGPSKVLFELTPRAREEVLAGMMSGSTTMCFGMSEPGAGSDAAMIQTRALKDGDGWRISGRKIWTSNAPHADYCLVLAITDPARAAARKGGISAFFVPTSSPGFKVESVIRVHGSVGGHEGAIVMDNVWVEPHQLIGKLNEGFAIGLLGVSIGRVYNSARALGMARWALETALEYTKHREAFGHPISEYQGVMFPLAESAMELHAAHLMGLNAATLIDDGERAIKELSMAKAYTVEVCLRAIDRAIQAHGAIGLTNELHLVNAWQDVRTINIADGTNEILRRTIAQRLLGGDLEL
ncbi:MAG TPA: acyl-CoA dehydrogenase family protein [Candidatus Binataceae bacterium]|nr:acyl-CoA dehydrogenase family protein [Candidatus Binataceae bacterium]